MNVDYKNAEQFESIARSAGFHDFDVMGNGCYADDFLQHFYLGWQASRQALSSCSEIPNSSGHASRQGVEGEPVAVVDRVGIMQRLSPYTNLPEGTKLYTHPASADKWIKCSEQRPNVLDVWIKMTDGSVVACRSQLDGDFYWKGGGFESYILENTVTHWKPRQQEQGHE